MAVKLHRCSVMWAKAQGHPCWKVQSALDEAGVAYELVKHPPLLRSRRKDVIEGTGQGKLPAIQREDGSWYRKDSGAMAEEIRRGLLSGDRGSAAPAGAPIQTAGEGPTAPAS
jgi:hypothetical protein